MISTASDIPRSDLRAAMNAAFSDYPIPMHLSQTGFDLMMRIRGFTAAQSRLAWVDDRIAGFWLVGVRGPRAYLISSGTHPDHRRQGLSRAIGQDVIAHLTSAGVKSLQSEVLENNPSARALYRDLGFSERRALDSFSLATPSTPLTEAIEAAPLPQEAEARILWDSTPSWQNDLASLIAAGDNATSFAIRDAAGLAAYAAFAPQTATLAQISVRRDRRRCGLGTALVAHGLRTLGLETVKLINLDRADTGASAFLQALGAKPLVSQRELYLEL